MNSYQIYTNETMARIQKIQNDKYMYTSTEGGIYKMSKSTTKNTDQASPII